MRPTSTGSIAGIRQLLILSILALLLAGCGSGSALEDTHWVLVALNGEPPLADTSPSAGFSADQISGSAGCNHYFGEYTAGDSDIAMGDLARTEMYCVEPEGMMAQEDAFLAALASATSYRLVGEQLELLDANGGLVLAFESSTP